MPGEDAAPARDAQLVQLRRALDWWKARPPDAERPCFQTWIAARRTGRQK